MQLTQKILQIDGEQLACEYELRASNAVILHGAGKANRTRYYGLAQALLDRGVGVVLFDFSGHGDSSGELKDLSLERRQKQAQAVIDELVPEGSLYLIGFSMGGQTLCDVLPHRAERLRGVLLCCPAIYSDAAWQLPFGNPEFTRILRTPESWAHSTAPVRLARFTGRAVIAVGSEDQVIPQGVVRLLRQSVPQHIYKEYEGVDHRLSTWFGDHPADAVAIIEQLLDAA